MGFIYKITNLVNGKVYIGQTRTTIKNRYWQHIGQAKYDPYPIHKAMKKYGLDNFKVEEIEQCDNSLLNDREIYWIAQYDSANGQNGYNATKGGHYYSFRCKKPVDVYDYDCNYIASYESISEASRALNINYCCIADCCKHIQHCAGKYVCTFKGEKPTPYKIKKIKVYQYDLDGNYIATFNSITEAAKIYGCGIFACVNNKLTKSCGYMWSKNKRNKISPYKKPVITNNHFKKPILAYKLDGTYQKQFNGLRECERELGIKSQNISGVCKGIYKQMQGYVFKYLSKEESSNVNA